MERLIFILEQIEESKRLIQIGGVPQLRMALLLLDNASEILMHREVQQALVGSRLHKNLLAAMIPFRGNNMNIQQDQEAEEIIKSLERHIISPVQIAKIKRYYLEKVKFLVEKGKLTISLGQVLSVTHRYRNLAYHQEKIRKETIRPIVLLFEVVCELLVILPSGIPSFEDEADYSWFESRYKISPDDIFEDKGLRGIQEILRGSLPLKILDFQNFLADHLEQRLVDFFYWLDFFAQHSRWRDTREGALKRIQFLKSQFWDSSRSTASPEFDKAFQIFMPKFSLEMVEEWHFKIKNLKYFSDKLSVFAEFANLEQFLEPIEEVVHEAAFELDAAIQGAIDRRRGK